ncbi:capsid assembly scaffolding protein Gp46 family protein [Limosilactobacillus mucosae]|uniref:capsid assembly scaffolding protein Gp46 family protein n=1 Tax=Limosilactobacillus mucosae TaxID=97478 RepID=UPI003C6D929D
MDNEQNTEQLTDDQEQAGKGAPIDTPEDDEKKVDSDKIVEKLKKRIGKEQASKHDLEKQLKDAQAEIERIKSGKSVKKLSDEDKAKKASDEKDAKIAELEAKLARNEAIKQTAEVFKESGLNVSDKVLDMVVANDDEKTYANVQTLIEFAQSIQSDTKKGMLKGHTPRQNGNNKMSKADIMKIPDPVKRVEAIKQNMTLFEH